MKPKFSHFLIRANRNHATSIFGSACLIALVISSLFHQGQLEILELSAYDQMMQYRPQPSSLQPSPVILIGINEEDIQYFGYPINDQVMSELLKKLLIYKPSTIGIDIFRDQASIGHQLLAEVVLAHPQIVLAEKILGTPVNGPSYLSNREQLGFIDLKEDRDARIRRGLFIMWEENKNGEEEHILSLATQLASRHLYQYKLGIVKDPNDVNQVCLGNTVLSRFSSNDGGYQAADDGGYQFILDYLRAPIPFPQYSLSQILNDEVDVIQIQNKVVIIGITAASVQDLHETPFSLVKNYGVEIHAHQTDQLIRTALAGNQPITHVNNWLEVLLLFICSVFGTILGFNVKSWRFAFIGIISTNLPLIVGYTFFILNLWLPVMTMMLAWMISFIFSAAWVLIIAHKERQQIMQLFGKFVAKPVAANLWAHRNEFIDNGRPRPQKLIATILMSDLRGYTTVSEAMQPIDVLEWVNSYMGVMTEIIEAHQGIVEDYAGDGIKSSFGVPIPKTNKQLISEDCIRAIDCALKMGKAFSQLSAQWHNTNIYSNYLRMGISHGQVIAGSIGNSHRMAYTTIGDVVNTAARLECFQKDVENTFEDIPFRILIDEATYQQLDKKYKTICLGKQFVRGKQHAVKIFRVLERVDINN